MGVGAREETGRDPTEGGAREGTEARETRELRGSGWGRAPLTGGLGAGRKMGANLVGGGMLERGATLLEGEGVPIPAGSELETRVKGKERDNKGMAKEPWSWSGAPNTGLLMASCSSRRFLARRWRGTNVGGLLEVGGEGAFLGPFPEFGERFEALGIVL